ncbi:hypothetical protein SARC_03542 [Sphaeroforma arctica JP610]|uniref:Uncharacterized protein n=1 Tax=Sphaeroforma arctica JP610 TaxID=667725 RepID=A0A0L0G5C6_9EUKA|nr:hypothetical protein SARC_03542 [Sphaeroforma arctica JP610]KNC84242.1 hypothetical protein SARC_03542 [Sphaeroforma arctica JP610]|eukprot:XP_014158144.1 hypothetical protein SARC_03542 [Sphaeroforma arctica JP610]
MQTARIYIPSGASEQPKSEPRDTLSVPQRGTNQRAKQKKIIADPAVEASLGSSTGDSLCDNPTNGGDEAAEIDTLEHTTRH